MSNRKLNLLATKMNEYGKAKKPFVFFVNFSCTEFNFFEPSDLDKENIKIDFNNFSKNINPSKFKLKITQPISKEEYAHRFEKIKKEILFGNSYLCNLTCETKIEFNENLSALYEKINAPYKILFKEEWLCFSPETFVKIEDGKIYTFPMKGTIDSSLPNAAETLLHDEKELAEHYTIVDLLRNDLSLVAENVRVEKFRYLEEIKTSNKTLLQASSKIVADLPNDYFENLGTIFCKLLPAGSISGAPKKKTVEIINDTEAYTRNFYTGVAGIFDGENLNSCVLIRFIEKTIDGFVYKSGGGITHQSIMEKEYEELLNKIYVPTF
ncbi:MAG: aminodeoxychorismate synthase component I [Chitinophagaceae bacterium]|nr:aminodeoxychorismate synthase component I [Chitinophagaceae bacterium]